MSDCAGAVRDRAVVAALQEDADLVRLLRIEVPPEVGPVRARRDEVERAVGLAHGLDGVGAVGRVQLDLLGQELVEAPGGGAQRLAPRLELPGHPGTVDRVELGRHAPDRVVDHGVGERRLQVAGGPLPLGPGEPGQEAPVHEARLPGQARRCSGTPPRTSRGAGSPAGPRRAPARRSSRTRGRGPSAPPPSGRSCGPSRSPTGPCAGRSRRSRGRRAGRAPAPGRRSARAGPSP